MSKPLQIVALLTGFSASIGALAFFTGYTVERAQFEIANIPFVYLDYWAYAESGMTAIQSIFDSLLASPVTLILITATSVLIILLLEFKWFATLIDRPRLQLPAWALIALLIVLAITQCLEIRSLRGLGTSGAAPLAAENDSVPAVAPFSWMVPDRIEPPESLSIEPFRRGSFAAWRNIADELEVGATGSSDRLSLREHPAYISRILPADHEPVDTILGIAATEDRLDVTRARDLFDALVAYLAFCMWLCVGGLFWHRRVWGKVAGHRAPDPGQGRIGAIFLRLREEILFSVRYVLIPVAVALLIIALVFFLPEAYGMLGRKHIGRDFIHVEMAPSAAVQTRQIGDSDDSETFSGISARQLQSLKPSPHGNGIAPEILGLFPRRTPVPPMRKAVEVATQFATEDGKMQDDLRRRWVDLVDSVERRRDPSVVSDLESLSNIARVLAPALAQTADTALSRVRQIVATRHSGYLLHPPRSDVTSIRIIARDAFSADSLDWRIMPLDSNRVREVRVSIDPRGERAREILREMPTCGINRRSERIAELLTLAHPNTLEFMIAGMFDPSDDVVGPCITYVGICADALGNAQGEILRRRRAMDALMLIARDSNRKRAHRGAAVTSIARLNSVGFRAYVEQECLSLFESLTVSGSDDHWVVRGPLITAFGLMNIEGAKSLLIELLSGTYKGHSVPINVRGAVPAALMNIGLDAQAASALIKIIMEPATPFEILLTSVSAIDRTNRREIPLRRKALAALLELVESTDRYEVSSDENQWDDILRVAMSSANQLAEDRSVQRFVDIASASNNRFSEHVRLLAIVTLAELQVPTSEPILLRILKNPSESLRIRVSAASALGEHDSNSTVPELVAVAKWAIKEGASDSQSLAISILKALQRRAEQGSDYAGAGIRQIQEMVSTE